MLVYRKHSHVIIFSNVAIFTSNTFHRYYRGEFNYDPLKVSQNKFLDTFTDHAQMVNKATHISGSLIDHVYITKGLMETFFTN